ncbi:MAG: antibiotic biosynthesis monooxygenase [Ilumatobacteraceae bacterium]|nr:antibiotic biosynthesis monooxygenase [Ilumatobacteraceae bacterium]
MSKVAMWVRLPLKPGVRDEAAAAFQTAVDNVQSEDGTLLYILHAEDADADALFVYELYTGQDALVAHSSADWFKAFGPTLAPFMAGRPEMHFLAPLTGKGL